MKRNNDKMLLESLVRKYGKSGVKNAIKNINESNKRLFKEIVLKPNQYVISFNGVSENFDDLSAGTLYITNDIRQTIHALEAWFDYDIDLNMIIDNIENARSWKPFNFDIDGYVSITGYKCV